MPKTYQSRNITITAEDTKTTLNDQGGKTVSAQIQVPAEASELAGIHVALGWDQSVVGVGVAMVRIEGDGLTGSSESVIVGSTGSDIATGNRSLLNSQYFPLDVQIINGNTISITGGFSGSATDIGNLELGVTAVFA